MPEALCPGSKQALVFANVSVTVKKFLALSGVMVPENVQPALESVKLPVELIVTIALLPSNRFPDHVPVIAARLAGVLKLNCDVGSALPVNVLVIPFSTM